MSTKREFKDVRAVNEACRLNYNGKGKNLYARTSGLASRVVRVIKARTVKGAFQVRAVSGEWHDANLADIYTN